MSCTHVFGTSSLGAVSIGESISLERLLRTYRMFEGHQEWPTAIRLLQKRTDSWYHIIVIGVVCLMMRIASFVWCIHCWQQDVGMFPIPPSLTSVESEGCMYCREVPLLRQLWTGRGALRHGVALGFLYCGAFCLYCRVV